MKHSSLFTFALTALFFMMSLLVYNRNDLGDHVLYQVLIILSVTVVIASLIIAVINRQWGIFIKSAVASVIASFPAVIVGLWWGQNNLNVGMAILDASLWAFPAFVLMFMTIEWLENRYKKKEKLSP